MIAKTIGRTAAGAGATALLTFICFRAHTDLASAIPLFMLLVVAQSMTGDFLSAATVSVVSAGCLDFFFTQPLFTLYMSNPLNVFALLAFLVTALVITRLVSRLREEVRFSRRRRVEAECLYDLSQRLLGFTLPSELYSAIPAQIMESFHTRSAALLLSDTNEYHACGEDVAELHADNLRAVLADGRLSRGPHVCATVLRLGQKPFGAIGIVPFTIFETTLASIATLIAITIERSRAIEYIAKVEAMRENERLKSTLLDAFSHDFRTPLTSIKGSVTGLLSDLDLDTEQSKDLLTVIDEECDRINRLLTRTTELTQLGMERFSLHLGQHAVAEIITAALADCRNSLGEREIRTEGSADALFVTADVFWASRILVQLLRNANLYSRPGTPITIRTELEYDFVVIRVADEGPGVDKAEISRIFERLYRGKAYRFETEGTGMGLAIAKAIVEAHGGTIGVVSDQHGSVFSFTLPVQVAFSSAVDGNQSMRGE